MFSTTDERNGDRFRLVVFDWDGTLMDSEAQIVAAVQAAIVDLDCAPRTDAACKDIIGLGLKEAVESLYPGYDAGFMTQFVERYRHHWFADYGSSQLFPGARDTLAGLKQAGFQLAVATGKGRPGLDRSLAETGLDALFDATRCADETRSKPHPQMLQELLDELKCTPDRALMVGDTEFDMHMARSAGTGALAVSYGVHDRERLLRCRPLACIDAIEELQPWLGVRPADTALAKG
jgi:phosphoglycolate phosphatase